MNFKIRTLCILLALILTLTGCNVVSTDKEYTALLCGYSDCISGVHRECEYDIWNQGMFQDDSAPEQMTVTIQDKTISGSYNYSVCVPQSNYVTHRYISYEPFASFGVDSNSNVVYFSVIGSDADVQETLTEVECQAVAKQFLLQNYADDLSDYRVIEVLPSGNSYTFTFTKYIGDYATADCVYVSVNIDGSVVGFNGPMFGRIGSDTDIDMDLDAIQQAAFEKLDIMFVDIQDQYAKITYDVTNISFTILADGSVAAYCTVNVECSKITKSDNRTTTEDVFNFLVQ